MSDSCTTQEKTRNEKTDSGHFASSAAHVTKFFRSRLKKKELRAREAKERFDNALFDYQLAKTGQLFTRHPRWLADKYSVPVKRIYRLKDEYREAMQDV